MGPVPEETGLERLTLWLRDTLDFFNLPATYDHSTAMFLNLFVLFLLLLKQEGIDINNIFPCFTNFIPADFAFISWIHKPCPSRFRTTLLLLEDAVQHQTFFPLLCSSPTCQPRQLSSSSRTISIPCSTPPPAAASRGTPGS